MKFLSTSRNKFLIDNHCYFFHNSKEIVIQFFCRSNGNNKDFIMKQIKNVNVHLFGILFLLLNFYPSFDFYTLNTFRLINLFMIIIILFCWDILYFKKEKQKKTEKGH
jgi:hypothetical protein